MVRAGTRTDSGSPGGSAPYHPQDARIAAKPARVQQRTGHARYPKCPKVSVTCLNARGIPLADDRAAALTFWPQVVVRSVRKSIIVAYAPEPSPRPTADWRCNPDPSLRTGVRVRWRRIPSSSGTPPSTADTPGAWREGPTPGVALTFSAGVLGRSSAAGCRSWFDDCYYELGERSDKREAWLLLITDAAELTA